ncbi:putative transmembrane protein [Toxoplasma gondii VAND]|uniref:Putative transmembrane protein n=1 Tax=Toxoplasma gondii VAND TaxID=933077 RepID=A0A086QB92_TOXGO|nr:putative transmembrane protein [Toxoplasma gondii VAND]
MYAVSVGVEEPEGGRRGSLRSRSPPSPARSSRTCSDMAKSRVPDVHYAPGKGPTQALRVACEKGRRRRLIKWACIISYISIFMSILFGVAAMICGVMGDVILSLVALAFETWIDMLSSVAVIWRFQEDEALNNGPSGLGPPPLYKANRSASAPLAKREDSTVSTALTTSKDAGGEKPKRTVSVSSLATPGSPKTSPSSPLGSSSPRSCASVPSPVNRLDGASSPYECVRPDLSVGEQGSLNKQESQTPAQEAACTGSVEKVPPAEPVAVSRLCSASSPPLSSVSPAGNFEVHPNNQTSSPFPQPSSPPPLNRSVSYAARERQSSMAVGALFIALSLWVSIHALCDLVISARRGETGAQGGETSAVSSEYRSALFTCILCWPSALIFGTLALVKFDLAARLRSQVLGRDAMCSAFGVALSLVAGIVSFVALGRVPPGIHDNAAAYNVTSYDAIAALVIGGMMLLEGIRTVMTNWKPTPQELLSSNQILIIASPSAYTES